MQFVVDENGVAFARVRDPSATLIRGTVQDGARILTGVVGLYDEEVPDNFQPGSHTDDGSNFTVVHDFTPRPPPDQDPTGIGQRIDNLVESDELKSILKEMNELS